jgi:ABC-type Fe3+/spermidine/putrescine transport system ATPase subunit
LFLADRVLVLESGSVRQQGAPADIYRNPVDEFVAGFLGAINLLKVTVDGEFLRIGAQRFALSAGQIEAPAAACSGVMHLAVRPEQLIVELGHCESLAGCVNGRLIATEFGGPIVTLRVDVEGQEISVLALSPDVLSSDSWQPGAPVLLRIRQARLLAATALTQ